MPFEILEKYTSLTIKSALLFFRLFVLGLAKSSFEQLGPGYYRIFIIPWRRQALSFHVFLNRETNLAFLHFLFYNFGCWLDPSLQDPVLLFCHGGPCKHMQLITGFYWKDRRDFLTEQTRLNTKSVSVRLSRSPLLPLSWTSEQV